MPIFRTTGDTESRLVQTPESGMGYQILYYRGDFLVAINATLICPLRELMEGGEMVDRLTALLAEAAGEPTGFVEPINLEDDFSLAYSQADPEIKQPNSHLNAPGVFAEPPVTIISPNRPHSYYRFCAGHRDKRVLPNGNFAPDTYATTYSDFHFVPSGFAAVGRFALPNPASARFVSQIVTYDRPSKMGTVTPNFGQAGGGVEVYFESGANNCPGCSFMIEAG